jgi:cytochrome b561
MNEPESPPARAPARGELIGTASALALLVLMFGMPWYGVAGVPGSSATRAATATAENAWEALTVLRWLMLATIVVTVASAVLHLTQRRHGTQTDTSLLLTVLGALTAALVTYRVLISLPAPAEIVDQKLGAVLGVFSALGIAFGGFDSLREERARARRLVQRSKSRAGMARGARAR